MHCTGRWCQTASSVTVLSQCLQWFDSQSSAVSLFVTWQPTVHPSCCNSSCAENSPGAQRYCGKGFVCEVLVVVVLVRFEIVVVAMVLLACIHLLSLISAVLWGSKTHSSLMCRCVSFSSCESFILFEGTCSNDSLLIFRWMNKETGYVVEFIDEHVGGWLVHRVWVAA